MSFMANRKCIGLLATAAMAMAGVMIPSVASADPDVRIDRITLRGPACPEGTAYVEVTPDRQAFVITYDEFHASAGPGVPPQESVKGCTALIDLDFPPGWSWTISSIAYSGSAQLDQRVAGRFSARLSFPGQRPVMKEVRMLGPTPPGGQDFDLLGDYDIFAWSPCGLKRPMTALATVQVDNSADRHRGGVVRVSQETGAFQMVFHVDWRRCR
ncbi:DUF4360 domain-containing protein [Chondromyces crocatus]|uniref:Secreted protein n=1 Tax=Chondromyces crocatus TaxID=52 RepID=A0A0K1EQY8_CHOCO|nr:DUF4360 domain-containing protein [Chondromyces crocatus]AKT43038.1 uncharacterized protein CMC5_072650 [Chondromyces crocatus]